MNGSHPLSAGGPGRLILCMDLDGPILDCEERHYAVYRDGIVEFGGMPLPRAEFWGHKRRRINERELLSWSGVDAQYHQQYTEKKIARIEDLRYLRLDTVQPDFPFFISRARALFAQTILITMRRERQALFEQLRLLGIDRHFDAILTDFREATPGWQIKVDLFLSHARDRALNPPSGYFIGDTETDIQAGKKLGLQTVAITRGIRTRELLQTCSPDHLVDTLQEILTIMSPEEKSDEGSLS